MTFPGGLYVMGTERHESRRIDNQLRGRSGRQGDPGRTKFYLSLEDDLMRIFAADRIDGMLQKLGLEEGEAITHRWINKALENAQKKVEARNFDARKYVLKYDDVMNDQRKVIFEQRIDIMGEEDVSETVEGMRHQVLQELVTDAHPRERLRRAVERRGPEAAGQGDLRSRSADRRMGRRGRHRRPGNPRAADQGGRRQGRRASPRQLGTEVLKGYEQRQEPGRLRRQRAGPQGAARDSEPTQQSLERRRPLHPGFGPQRDPHQRRRARGGDAAGRPHRLRLHAPVHGRHAA